MKNGNELPQKRGRKKAVHDYPQFRERLEYIRINERKLSKRSFAKLIGISDKTYRIWINGEYDATENKIRYPIPDIDSIIKVCKALGVSMDYVFGRSNNISAENEVISKAFLLNDKAIENLKDIASQFLDLDSANLIRANAYMIVPEPSAIDTLNKVFSSPSFGNILEDIYNFMSKSDFKYPVHYCYPQQTSEYKGRMECQFNNIKGMDYAVDGTPQIYLSRSQILPIDNTPVKVTDTFIESSALYDIQKMLLNIKNPPQTQEEKKSKKRSQKK